MALVKVFILGMEMHIGTNVCDLLMFLEIHVFWLADWFVLILAQHLTTFFSSLIIFQNKWKFWMMYELKIQCKRVIVATMKPRWPSLQGGLFTTDLVQIFQKNELHHQKGLHDIFYFQKSFWKLNYFKWKFE